MATSHRNPSLSIIVGLLLIAGTALPALSAPDEPDRIRFVRVLEENLPASGNSGIVRVADQIAYRVAGGPGGGVFLWDEEAAPVATIGQLVPGGGAGFEDFGALAFDGTRVAFIARDSSGITGLYLWDGSAIRTLVDTTMTAPDGITPILGLSNVAMNAGLIAFQAEIPSLDEPGGTAHAVYTRRLGSIEPVLLPGDILDGDSVVSAELAPGGLEGDALGLQVRFATSSASITALYLALVPAEGHDLVAKDFKPQTRDGGFWGTGGPKIDSDHCGPELIPGCIEEYQLKIKNNGDHAETNVTYTLTANSGGPFVSVGTTCSGTIASLEPGQTFTKDFCGVHYDGAPGCVDLTLTVSHDPPQDDADPSNNSITRTFRYDVTQCP